MKRLLQGTFTYDIDTRELRFQTNQYGDTSCFSLMIEPKISAQLGTWQQSTLSPIRLTFDKDGADFVCSDITNQ